MRWATWFEAADRHVRDSFQGDVRVSTVFLGLDHSVYGPPQLFETMVFVGHGMSAANAIRPGPRPRLATRAGWSRCSSRRLS
jgi:hypothetical protein